MHSAETLAKLDGIANHFVRFLFPLPQTTALIVRSEKKYDRVDSKLLKEADKLNKK